MYRCCCRQVRAAAVFALGTFISNVKSDHANSINLIVGMKLVHVANDGSPLVRKVMYPGDSENLL